MTEEEIESKAESIQLQSNHADKELDCESKPMVSKKFPKIVILIVFNEFCERFAYSGMRAFLALYLKQKLYYSDDEATEIYHGFSTLVYFFPVFGAILADCYLGKYRTILYMMVIYGIGNVTLAVTAVPTLEIPARTFTMIGLILVSLGAGGIKPCVSAFGGEQFILPEQEKQLTTFFSVYYFSMCIGSFVAKTVSPLLRSEVHCFGDKDCYSFAFGGPGFLILSSIVTFAIAKKMYIIKKPTGNVVLDFTKCICKALKNRLYSKEEKKKSHWLDYAKDSYEESFIADIKRTLAIFVLFFPLPVFWSLLDQMGSRWTLQAAKMDGFFGIFTVRPDQMQVMCPILILLLIPVYKKLIYPGLAKYGIFTDSLHKLICGCIFAALAFISSGLLERKLEKTYPILPSNGLGQLRIFNGHNCNMSFVDISKDHINNSTDNFTIYPHEFYENKFIKTNNQRIILYNKTLQCKDYTTTALEHIYVEEFKAVTYFYNSNEESGSYRYTDNVEKSRSGLPYIRFLTSVKNESEINITLYDPNKDVIEYNTTSLYTNLVEVFSAKYHLYVNSELILTDVYFKIGGVYTIMVEVNDDQINANVLTVTEPNSVSMIWLLPQIIIISNAEILFAITGLEFAFKEAPESMKAVLQAYWLLVEAFGNVIIIVVTRLAKNYSLVSQFFFYAVFMFVSTIIFYILTKRYNRSRNNNVVCKNNDNNYDLVKQNE